MGKTPEQILSDIRGIKAETDPHDITAPRLGGTLEDMLAFSKDTAEKVDGLPAPSEQNYKGKITITDLLALSVDIGDNDLYLVYSSGSDVEGWSEEGSFTLNGNSYADGTFVQWMGDGWMAVNAEDVNIEKVALFNPLSDKMDIIVKTYPQTSYDHLYGRSRYGMMIADVACYELDDETGAYKPKIERMTGQYAGSTNLKTLFVPFARYYYQGGEFHYEGGALTAADYRRLMEVGNILFFATYGTTTFSEIENAVQNGREVLCVSGDDIYRLTTLAGSNASFFSFSQSSIREIFVNDDNDWIIREYSLPSDSGTNKMDKDASNAETDAIQNLLDTLLYTSNALTGDDTLVMKIDSANAYKEIPITSLADYIAAPVLASPGSGSISDWDGRLVYQSVGANRTISAVLSPVAVNTAKHSVAIGNSTASGDYSFASGYGNTASGNYSFAAGQNNAASNVNTACLGGYGNTASGQSATCIGGSSSTASAMHAVTAGVYALADHDHMMAIGKYSRGWTASCAAHGISAAGSDYLLFTVGSGAGPNSRKNSFEVWSTDEAYIGDRGVATLYTITCEGTASSSDMPVPVYGKGLSIASRGWDGSIFGLGFFPINYTGSAKSDVFSWYSSHTVSVMYWNEDTDEIITSMNTLGLSLAFKYISSSSRWVPQVKFNDETLFKNKNYKCVIQFIGK